jgi:chromosome segregation ATPase
MTNCNKHYAKYTSLIIALALLVTPAFAHGTEKHDYAVTDSKPDKRALLADDTAPRKGDLMKDSSAETRCLNRQKRIDNVINMMNKTHRFQIERFTRIYDRVSALSERLADQDVDTTQLDTDLETLNTKIENLKTKHDGIIAKLQEMKTEECDPETMNNSLPELKNLVQEARQATQDIRTFLTETLKTDLLDLKDEIKMVRKDTKSGSTEPEN